MCDERNVSVWKLNTNEEQKAYECLWVILIAAMCPMPMKLVHNTRSTPHTALSNMQTDWMAWLILRVKFGRSATQCICRLHVSNWAKVSDDGSWLGTVLLHFIHSAMIFAHSKRFFLHPKYRILIDTAVVLFENYTMWSSASRPT